MVSLSQRQGLGRETDGDWLTPLKIFVRDTLASGVKLNYRHLHMLLGTVWKMVLSQRSKCKWCDCLKCVNVFLPYLVWNERVFWCSGDRGPAGSRLCLLQAEAPNTTGTISAAVVLQQALPSGAGTYTHSKVRLSACGPSDSSYRLQLLLYCSTLTIVPVCYLLLSLSRSKVLCRWLASLPVQLYQLGHRNPALSGQIIASIQAAASRGHKEMLNSLQTNACMIYGMNMSLMTFVLPLIK